MARPSFQTITLTIVVSCLSGIAAIGMLAADAEPTATIHDDHYTQPFFRRLAETRRQRKSHIVAYFNSCRQLAEEIDSDPLLMKAFTRLYGTDAALSQQDELALDTHYVNHYGEFFDILFIAGDGFVFHSVRRESDYHSNLFTGSLADTKLARRLPDVREITFIEFELYSPSDEPGAFFVVPIYNKSDNTASDNEPHGWVALQCPLNKLNSILTGRDGLGRTGEIYLVNTEQQMVTNSRFHPDPVELNLMVDTEAVTKARQVGTGQEIIQDYRGVRVLSSFEPLDLFGTTWILIAEIDESEAITEYYKLHRQHYQEAISQALIRQHVSAYPNPQFTGRHRRVDMNEFAQTTSGICLTTQGVSTCSAVTIVLPGRFGYLAHIGPNDRIYGKSDQGYNNCLGEMLARMCRYDIYPHQLAELEITIIATHGDSYVEAVEHLLSLGIELSQIKFAYLPDAAYSNVTLAPDDLSVWIEWLSHNGASVHTKVSDFDSMGDIVRNLSCTGNPGNSQIH